MIWPHVKAFWHLFQGTMKEQEDLGDKRRDGKQHHGMDGSGAWRFPEGSGRHGKVEEYC